MTGEVHTIFVPLGWSPEQVWEAIRRGDPVPVAGDGVWVNVREDGSLIYEEDE